MKVTSESPCIGICLIIDNGMDEFCDLLDLNLVPVDTVDLPSKKMHKVRQIV